MAKKINPIKYTTLKEYKNNIDKLSQNLIEIEKQKNILIDQIKTESQKFIKQLSIQQKYNNLNEHERKTINKLSKLNEQYNKTITKYYKNQVKILINNNSTLYNFFQNIHTKQNEQILNIPLQNVILLTKNGSRVYLPNKIIINYTSDKRNIWSETSRDVYNNAIYIENPNLIKQNSKDIKSKYNINYTAVEINDYITVSFNTKTFNQIIQVKTTMQNLTNQNNLPQCIIDELQFNYKSGRIYNYKHNSLYIDIHSTLLSDNNETILQ